MKAGISLTFGRPAAFPSPLSSNQPFLSACQHTISKQFCHLVRTAKPEMLILASRTRVRKESGKRVHVPRQLYSLKQEE